MPLSAVGRRVALDELVDLVCRVADFLDGDVVVQRIDDACHVLAHLCSAVPFAGEELRRLVDQVGRDDFADDTVFIILVKFFQTICEEAECAAHVYVFRAAALQLLCDIKHAPARGDHIVDDDAVLSLDGIAEKFMGNYRIFSVDNAGIIAAFIEHTHIHTEYIGKINGPRHSTFIRADDHDMIIVEMNVRLRFQQSFQKLVGGEEVIKSHERYCVGHAGIMCIEGDDVGHAHAAELFQSDGTVQRLAVGALVLTALIEKRHEYSDTVSFAVDRRDHAL